MARVRVRVRVRGVVVSRGQSDRRVRVCVRVSHSQTNKQNTPPQHTQPPPPTHTQTPQHSYPKLAQDVSPGCQILCADGSIVLEVVSCDAAAGTVRARCKNSAMLGERKNVNLPGVVVDLPTLTEKDVDDLVSWGVPNEIDLIAASFVRKGKDLDYIREVLGERGR